MTRGSGVSLSGATGNLLGGVVTKSPPIFKLPFTILALVLTLILCLPGQALAAPPVADAGEDQSILVNELTRLYGTATDPGGDDIVLWTWTIEAQPPGSTPYLSNAFVQEPEFRGNIPGDYILSLVVNDGTDDSAPDMVTITVNDNLPPTADADADVTSGYPPLTVNFDGTGSSDPEGRPLSYHWYSGDGYSFGYDPTFTHVYEDPGTYIANLLVIDDARQTDDATIIITVTAAMDLSVAKAKVIYRRCTSSMGKVKLAADFAAPMPQAADRVAVYFDGIKLFDVPFSHFTQCLVNPDAYKYVRLKTFVKINFAAMRIKVIRLGLNLSTLVNANGVDVKLMMGADTAVEDIIMEQVSCRRLRYIRSD